MLPINTIPKDKTRPDKAPTHTKAKHEVAAFDSQKQERFRSPREGGREGRSTGGDPGRVSKCGVFFGKQEPRGATEREKQRHAFVYK